MRLAILRALTFTILTTSMPASGQMITQSQVDRKREKDKAKLLKLTVDQFVKTVAIKDDDLETIATIDTKRGFRPAGGFFDIQGSDIFLRALVDKASGKATFQAYQLLWYKHTQLRDYRIVNYQLGENAIGTAVLTRLSERVIECDQYSAVLGCTRSEEVVFEIPELLLRQIASRPADQVWRIKFRAQSGNDWEEIVSPLEAAGLLSAVETFVHSRSK